MEEGGVELVLSRAVELRLKISNCIHKATVNAISNTNDTSVSSTDNKQEKEGLEDGRNLKGVNDANPNSLPLDEASHKEEDEDYDEDAERLLHIRDALESLEHQLSNLQALQQQQRYEREVALSEIEHSRKMLLDKLKEYKGTDLEVIQEASTFVAETVEHSNDLLLPPYPSRPPASLVLDNRYLSHPAVQKSLRNGLIAAEVKKNLNHSNSKPPSNTSRNSRKGLGSFIGAAVKTLITVAGVISVFSLSGFGPKFGNRRLPFKIVDLFQQPANEEKSRIECPPGRVLVMENGESHCVVKERVAIPFGAAVAKPGVDYGCG